MRRTGMFGMIDGAGFETIEPEFEACFIGHARVERL
jgi:gluconolactonase